MEGNRMQDHEQPWRSLGNDKGLSALLLGLARDVRKVIHGGPSDSEEIACLNDRIFQLRGALNARNDTPLGRWFENLQRQLDPAACESTLR
jgi:hypothetical protein